MLEPHRFAHQGTTNQQLYKTGLGNFCTLLYYTTRGNCTRLVLGIQIQYHIILDMAIAQDWSWEEQWFDKREIAENQLRKLHCGYESEKQ